jgi:sugar-specific transcriptional regulator TrmB
MERVCVFESLTSLGLDENEARIYLYLTNEGPQKARNIGKALNISTQRIYRSLRKLQIKGIVNASSEHPACFSAVPFDIVLDLFVEAKIEVAKQVIESKEELISTWRSITEKDEEKS